MLRQEKLEVDSRRERQDVLEKHLGLTLVGHRLPQFVDVVLDGGRLVLNVALPGAAHQLALKQFEAQANTVLSKNLAKDGLQLLDVRLQLGHAHEELVEVLGGAGD